MDSPVKPLNAAKSFDVKSKGYPSEIKMNSLAVPQSDLRQKKFLHLNPVSERSQYNEDDENEHEGSKTGRADQLDKSGQEDNFGFVDPNHYISFNTFNSSHLKEDNSFIDSSFNTMLNINAELNEEQKSSFTDKLKSDLEANKLPSNYYKFRIFVPEKGELICKQHVIDLSTVKVISSTQNSLGKIFIPKKTYLDYMFDKSPQSDGNSSEGSIKKEGEFRTANAMAKVSVPSIHSSFEKTSDSKTFDLEFKDGSCYSGQVVKHGFGTFKDARGNVYEGNWQLDKKQGYGKQTFVADSFHKHDSTNDSAGSIETDFYKKGGKLFSSGLVFFAEARVI